MSLPALREDLRKSMEGMPVYTYNHLPGSASMPSAIVLAGAPYLEAGETYGSWVIRLEVWLSAAKGSNDSETSQVDELITQAIDAIETYNSPLTDGWVVESVSQPFEFSHGTGTAFTASLTVTASGVTFI